jgi:hypothetical protein
VSFILYLCFHRSRGKRRSSLDTLAVLAALYVLLDVTELSLLGEIAELLKTTLFLSGLVLFKTDNTSMAHGELVAKKTSRCLIGCFVPDLVARTANGLVGMSFNMVKTIFLANRAFHYIIGGEKKVPKWF